ncbi:hypothetical protein Sango_0937300 [Sesamum angolense]|uniref:Uncharacterized protein n=1 Tax=Sesamum angolense TaxID=2727404 RepID=A0AAE1WYY4_9LAMI|nr:hypothetical protein Sango_0937300 [Sesamum angolense]
MVFASLSQWFSVYSGLLCIFCTTDSEEDEDLGWVLQSQSLVGFIWIPAEGTMSPTNLWVTKVFVGRGFEYGLPYSEQSPSETQYEYSFRIVESLTHEESDIPRRSKRARVVKDFGSDFVTYNIEDDPITFKDAMASSEAKQWKEAVKSEMDSIISNGTWVLVDLPPGCTTIGCKWIFKKYSKSLALNGVKSIRRDAGSAAGSGHMAYSVNPKDQHKAGGVLLLTDIATPIGSNSRHSSI